MESIPRAGRKSRKLGSRRRHQMKEFSDEDPPPAPDTEQWPFHATEELQDFFRACGAEHKGFITREDLGKAKFSFLGSPEELQLIFDWMDPERKGSLTPKEFTSGLKNVFSSQTRIPGPMKRKTRTWIFSKEEPTNFQPLEEADPEERRWFLSFMEQLGADQLFVDQAEIWQLWKKLRQEEPHLVGNLEGFLTKMTSCLQETWAEKEALQMSLKKCDDDHHYEVQQLYEEMEQQIHSEKQRLQAASDTQGLAYSSMMHQALEAKERQMQYLTEGQRELEAQINLLKSEHHEVSMENQRLQETQRDLTGQLEQAQGNLQMTRGHLHLPRGQVSWLVEEKTSPAPNEVLNGVTIGDHVSHTGLTYSNHPAGPKNTSDSQHLISFPEENPLPSLFEEGEWSQLLNNFTSPLPGNTTQVSWSPPPTPTSLQGHHTPRVVRQISITKPKSWQLNQESPSDPEVPSSSLPRPSAAAPTVVSELKITGEPKHEETFQWDFQRVPSGEPAITTGGQAGPVLGDNLPSQGLARSGKRVRDTDGDEVGQGNGPISDMFSKSSSSEESLQTQGSSANVQANTWEVCPKEMPHAGLHPVGLEQEVGSWENEVFTAGPDVPIKTPELVLIQESIPTREQEQEKMNTDGWEVETNQQNDASGQKTGLRESTGPDVGEVPGEGSRSTESLEPDMGEIPGVGSRSIESPEPDMGEIPGVGSRSTESPEPDGSKVPGDESRLTKSLGPDVKNAPRQETGLTESPGPDIGNFHAQETSHIDSPRPDVDGVLSQEDQILKSLDLDVGKAPDQETQLIHLATVMQLPGAGNVSGKESELIISSRADTGNDTGQEVGVLELAQLDVGNVLCKEVGLLESAELERNNHPGQEIRLYHSPGPDVYVYRSYKDRILGSFQLGVGDGTELHQLIVRHASDQEFGFMTSPEVDAPSQEVGLIGSPGPDGDDVTGQETMFMESWEIDIKDNSRKEAQVLHSPGPDVGETPRQGNVFMSSSRPDVADATGQEDWMGIGDAAVQEARVTELCRGDVGNASDQGSELIVELHVDDTPGQENEFIQSGETDTKDTSGKEGANLYSPGTYLGDVPGQGARYIESSGSDVSDVAIQEAGLMNSSVIDIINSPGQEDKSMVLPETDVGTATIQESKHIDEESGLEVGDTPGQETRFSELARPNIGGAFLYSTGPDVEDALNQEARFIEPPRKDVDDATVQGPGVAELFKVAVENTSDQETRIIRSPKVDVPSGETGLVESTGLEMGDAAGQEARFRELWKRDVGNALGQAAMFRESWERHVGDNEIADITYSPDPDMSDSPDQEAGVVELYGLNVSETPIQETRVLESSETDVSDGPGRKVVISASYEAEVRNTSAQDTEIMYSSLPGMSDATGQETEILHSPGPHVEDSPDQEAGLKGSFTLDLAGAPGQKGRFMESPEAGVNDGSSHQVEQMESLESDVRDTLGQEGMFRESCEIYEEDTIGLMEAPVPGLGETPGQEGKFLVSPEKGVDNGSSQVTGSPGPNMRDAPGPDAGFRESYETDVEDAFSKVEFDPDEGDVVTGQGILVLETHEPGVNDVSSPDEITGLIESYGPEMDDIPNQEVETMHLLGSDGAEAVGQEAKFMELCEIVEGNVEIAEIMYSPVPDMSDCPDQEAGVGEFHRLYVSETLEARVLESPKTDVDHGPGQEVVISESYEAGVGNASAQDAETIHSPRAGLSDSAGLEAEMVISPGPYVGDSPSQEGVVTELYRPDVGNASDQEARFMPLSEADVSDGAGQEAEILHSPGPEVEDSSGKEGGLKKSLVLNLGGAPGQESRFLELSEVDVDDGSCQQAGQIRSPGPDVNDAPGQETEIFYYPSQDVGDYPHQGTYRLIDFSRPLVDILSDGKIPLPESPEPSLGDAPEEKSGNIESPRPDVLPVIPEHGGLRDQNPEDVWRAEDKGLQRQASEGSLFPKDSSGNTLDPQDSEQSLSILVEAGARSGSKVLGGQITPLSSEPREENRSGFTKETKAEAAGASPGGRSPDPDYLFHVLFLGDSNVGKTSFLHLLHHDSFATGLTATVGMDYRVKNLVVDNRQFSLQLWDTAGQERYHSITKQFLRKADGIVLMYDVTCLRSFTHVHYWLDCIQEAGPNDVVVLLLGNKIDCVEERQVSTEAGQLLAKEIGVIFGECSAILGHNILEPIVTLARALQEQDTKLKHSVVELAKKEAKKKNGCCS